MPDAVKPDVLMPTGAGGRACLPPTALRPQDAWEHGRRGVRESPQQRRHRARALGGLFAAGAAVSTVAIVLPGWPGADRAGIAVTALLAAGGAGILLRFAGHVGSGACHAFLASGTVLIAACQVLAGSAGAASYALLYVWVALHAALFFGARAVAWHLVFSVVAQAVALGRVGEHDSWAPQLALTLGTQIAAALVVGFLAARLRRLADTDALTGVRNRRGFEQAVTAALARCAGRQAVCLAVLDLDGFKDVNDRLGHAAGDRVLVDAATAWREVLRPGDTLARTGGDEFMVLLTGCGMDEAEGIVQRLLASTPAVVSCCAGLAEWDGQEAAESLAGRADRALYAAKAAGSAGLVRAAASMPKTGAHGVPTTTPR